MDRKGGIARGISQRLVRQQFCVVPSIAFPLGMPIRRGEFHGEVVDFVDSSDEMCPLVDEHGRPRVRPAIGVLRPECDVVLRFREMKTSHGRVGEYGYFLWGRGDGGTFLVEFSGVAEHLKN